MKLCVLCWRPCGSALYIVQRALQRPDEAGIAILQRFEPEYICEQCFIEHLPPVGRE